MRFNRVLCGVLVRFERYMIGARMLIMGFSGNSGIWLLCRDHQGQGIQIISCLTSPHSALSD